MRNICETLSRLSGHGVKESIYANCLLMTAVFVYHIFLKTFGPNYLVLFKNLKYVCQGYLRVQCSAVWHSIVPNWQHLKFLIVLSLLSGNSWRRWGNCHPGHLLATYNCLYLSSERTQTNIRNLSTNIEMFVYIFVFYTSANNKCYSTPSEARWQGQVSD